MKRTDTEPRRGNGLEINRLPTSHGQPDQDDWIVWQLVDSAFPTGGFAHSAGLEAAVQHAEIRNRSELVSFLESNLQQLGRAALPLVKAAFDKPDLAPDCDRLCEAFTTNHVANRASRLQGRAFLAAVNRIFPQSGVKADASAMVPNQSVPESPSILPFFHFAPVFGSSLKRLGLPYDTTGKMFFFNHLRGMLAAAVRLNILGPMEAQTLQQKLSIKCDQVLVRCSLLTLEDIAQSAPLLDLWQGAHDRLYSRLFQS
jgi:urease accessory protein